MSPIYERWRNKLSGKLTRINFWFVSQLSFEDLAKEIKYNFHSIDEVDDYENVYQWSEFCNDEGRYFNLSIKHLETVNPETNPFRLFIEDKYFDQFDIDQYAFRIKKVAQNEVNYGKVVYTNRDEFKYITTKTY